MALFFCFRVNFASYKQKKPFENIELSSALLVSLLSSICLSFELEIGINLSYLEILSVPLQRHRPLKSA